MKTTLEMPDALIRKIKSTAARRGQTMAAFINAAVEAKLKSDEALERKKPWMEFSGVFRDQREDSARIMSAIEKDCEAVRPEDWE